MNYYAIGFCKIEDYELESFKLFEAGVASLEELEAKKIQRLHLSFTQIQKKNWIE